MFSWISPTRPRIRQLRRRERFILQPSLTPTHPLALPRMAALPIQHPTSQQKLQRHSQRMRAKRTAQQIPSPPPQTLAIHLARKSFAPTTHQLPRQHHHRLIQRFRVRQIFCDKIHRSTRAMARRLALTMILLNVDL